MNQVVSEADPYTEKRKKQTVEGANPANVTQLKDLAKPPPDPLPRRKASDRDRRYIRALLKIERVLSYTKSALLFGRFCCTHFTQQNPSESGKAN
jgi:hypothetical protein